MRQNHFSVRRFAGALVLRCVMLVTVLALSAVGLRAQGGTTAQECCPTLRMPYGAIAASLGQALTARSTVDGMFYNPANLAIRGRYEVIIHYDDRSINEERLGNYVLSIAM